MRTCGARSRRPLGVDGSPVVVRLAPNPTGRPLGVVGPYLRENTVAIAVFCEDLLCRAGNEFVHGVYGTIGNSPPSGRDERTFVSAATPQSRRRLSCLPYWQRSYQMLGTFAHGIAWSLQPAPTLRESRFVAVIIGFDVNKLAILRFEG